MKQNESLETNMKPFLKNGNQKTIRNSYYIVSDLLGETKETSVVFTLWERSRERAVRLSCTEPDHRSGIV